MRIYFLFLFFTLSFYGQNDTISVVRHTDKDIIFPKELKVIYRGIPNSLFIDVPNSKSFKVYGNGLTMYSKNSYYINPDKESLEVIINIDIVLKNNKKITEKHLFKIRNLGKVIATINFIEENNIKLQKSNLKGATLRIKFEDENLKQDFIFITKFKVKIPGRKDIEINGNSIYDKAFEEINKYSSKNDIITIYDIRTVIHCGISAIHLDPIIIRII
jgi:hypothetical protein